VELTDRHRSELAAIGRLGLPLALAGLGQMLLDAVGLAVAGRSSEADLAAVGFGGSVFFTLAVFGAGVVLGVEPLIARAMGSGDRELARRSLVQGLWLALGFGLGLGFACACAALLVPGRVGAYLAFRAPSALPYLAVIALRSFLGARGQAGAILWSVLAANVVHALLAPFLVIGLELGAAGAGLGATLATVVQLGAMLWFTRKEAAFAALDPEICRRALLLGLPIGGQMLAEFGVFSLAGALALKLGTRSLAAHQVAITLAGITFTVSVGIASAGALRIAAALGRGDREGAHCARRTALFLGATFMSIAAIVFVIAPRSLAGLFSPDSDVIEAALPLLLAAAAFQLFDGVQAVAQGALRGAGDTRSALVANLLGHYVFGLPLGVVLAFALGWGVVGIWWGLCAGLALVSIVLVLRAERAIPARI
jgi:MATE family multidrug resistance protein